MSAIDCRCRQFDETNCSRGSFCNFMHLKNVPKDLVKDLVKGQPHAGENKPTVTKSPEYVSPQSPMFLLCVIVFLGVVQAGHTAS